MGLRIARRRAAARDEGTIVVLAAVIIPVILTVIALALSTLVWATSETEAQRASDQAALQAASSEVLVPNAGVSAAPLFPTLNSLIPSSLTAAVPGLASVTASLSQNATSCKTVGNVYTSVKPLTDLVTFLTQSLLGLPTTTQLNNALAGLNPSVAAALQNPTNAVCSSITVVPDTLVSTFNKACAAASANMSEDRAPWSYRFFDGTGSRVPDCATNGRVSVKLVDDGSSLLSLGGTTLTTPGGPVSATSVFNQVQTALGLLGVRLQTTLPNTLCPTMSVSVDQPVRGPISERISVPNGRSTAKRVVKNAIIVPVFNGAGITSTNPLGTVSGTITTPPVNLNTAVLGPLQSTLVGTLDAVNTAINQNLASRSIGVSNLVGAQVGQLDLLGCLRDTVADLYNPPTSGGAAPTTQQVLSTVLKDAADTGNPVQVIQVGVRNCSGAVTALDIYGGCIAPALGTVAGTATGLYDVPFLDVTPLVVKDVGNGNFQGVPVSATQASGAFRSVLVRSSGDDRYVP